MYKGKTAAVLAVCAALAACEADSTRDLTAPEPGAVNHDAAALGTLGRYVILADGAISPAPGTDASLRRFGGDASVATSGTTQCDRGFISGGTYDNIEVPPDQECILEGVTVTNWVRAFAGSQLFIYTSQIGGNVEGLGAKTVQLQDETTVVGDMDVQNAGGGPFASCAVDNSTIQGNLSCTGNNPGSPVIRPFQGPVTIGGSVNLERNVIPPGNVLFLQNTSIGANADINKNTGSGAKSVVGNTVANKLGCKKNDPPFDGGPNVANKAKGQCF